MRNILKKELDLVLERRGLRRRRWAVEWDDSAIDLLLEIGFSPDLGARPLKRAIERHLLAPLARTIVKHEFPEGDQFLFVRAEGKRIRVEFVDPDLPESVATTTHERAGEDTRSSLQLEALALDALGHGGEVAFLARVLSEFRSTVDADDWRTRKAKLLSR